MPPNTPDLDAVPGTPESPPQDRYEGLPVHWSESAMETYCQIEEANPNLGPASTASLWECVALIALADACRVQVEKDGPMVQGARSMVAHPLIAEERHARAAALAGLRALGLDSAQSPASAAGASLAARRWHGRTPGVRAGR